MFIRLKRVLIHHCISRVFAFRFALLFFCFLFTVDAFAQHKKALTVIFDSDMGPDYDDVGAIALLHAFADSGKVKILATMASTKYEGVAGVFSVFNTYFNRPGIPIGVPKDSALTLKDWQHWTDTLLANYPHKIKSNREARDAVALYRELLAAQPDRSVTIITVGFFTNLARLLQSGADRFSALNGRDLVKKKVRSLASMAGHFPSGKEFNVEKDAAASEVVFASWPTPVLFSGFEIGARIKTGLQLVQNENIRHSPVKDVFRICLPMAKEDSAGRMSWDETAVLVAVQGYHRYYTIQKGQITIEKDGRNGWQPMDKGHAHLVERVPPGDVQAVINRLLMHQPSHLRKKQ